MRLLGIQNRHRQQAQDARQAVRADGAELLSCNTEDNQRNGVEAMAVGRNRGNRVEPEEQTGFYSSNLSEWRWQTQGGVVRSRSSSTSTMGSTSMSDSMISGCERSTAGSLNTSMTTLGSTSPKIIQVVGESERGLSAKRRKANVGSQQVSLLSTPLACVGSTLAHHHHHHHHQSYLQYSHTSPPFPPTSDKPLSNLSSASLPPPTNSLHKLLLDHHQVSAFDLVHRWAHDDSLLPTPTPPPAPATPTSPEPSHLPPPPSPSLPIHSSCWLSA